MKSILFCLLVVVATSPLTAQQWRWPDAPKNLKVLPASATGRELQRVMNGFTGALGVKCIFCHVGEEGKNFGEWDFASDAKAEKRTTRTMVTMLKAINTEYLADIEREGAPAITVSCVTCHRGSPAPVLLEDKLKRTFDVAGVDSVIREYKALKEQFFGGFTYNFKEGTLLRLADKILEDTTKYSEAIRIVKLNIEAYPNFAFSYVHLASYYEDMGNIPAAVDYYQQAIKLNPKDERLQRQLQRLQGKK
jgi:tetratricopeptide (TPR) repeat protein